MGDPKETAHAARSGDHAAFDSLFARNLPRLVAFVRARAGGVIAARESAHDLALSVCREALEDIGDFEFRGEEAFRHWLFVRATRKICNRHRFLHREKRDVSREVQPVASDTDAEELMTAYATLTTPSRVASARDEMARIEAALAELPEAQREAIALGLGELREAQREAIALTRVAELSYAEAAEQLGKTEAALRGLVMRGLARLSALLEQSEE